MDGRKVNMVLWISYEMNDMYSANSERNRVIYELWEKNLTVDEISSLTGIPRSTVGYYVRKFNKLAAKGKPAVFLGPDGAPRVLSSCAQGIQFMSKLEERILSSMVNGNWEGLYYRLSAFKLLKELGLLTPKGQTSFLSKLDFWLDSVATDQLYEAVESLKRRINQGDRSRS